MDGPMKKPQDPELQDKVARLLSLVQRRRAALEARTLPRMSPGLARRFGADDVLQEASLLAVKAMPRTRANDDQGFFRLMLLMIERALARLGRDHGKRTKKRDHSLERPLEAAVAVPDPGTSVTGKMKRIERRVKAQRAAADLPPAQRQVIDLVWKGMTDAEIAQQLGCSQKAVHDRYRRAQQALEAAVLERSEP
jgi:RNA polymerase sigma factor (sigma-70 family)